MSTFVLSADIEQLVEDPVGLPTLLMLAESTSISMFCLRKRLGGNWISENPFSF
jgi:hypothetical protein